MFSGVVAVVPVMSSIVMCLTCVVFLAASWILIVRPLTFIRHYYQMGLKGRKWIPLVGDFLYILRLRERYTEAFHEGYMEWARKFGSVSLLYYGPSVRVLICEASLLRDALVTHGYAFVKPPMENFERMLGAHSLLLSEGDVHRHHRRIVSTAFQFSALKQSVPLMGNCALLGAQQWSAALACGPLSDGWGELEIHERVTGITLDIIGRSAFATTTASLADASGNSAAVYHRISEALAIVLKATVSLTMFIPGTYASVLCHRRFRLCCAPFAQLPLAFVTSVGWIYVPTPTNLRIKALSAEVRGIVSRIVTDRRALRRGAISTGRTSGDQPVNEPPAVDVPVTLLDLLLDANDGGSRLTDEDVIDQAVTFLLAGTLPPLELLLLRYMRYATPWLGHETTTQVVTWAMYLLANYPEWQARLRAEVTAVCGGEFLSIPLTNVGW